MACKDSRPQSKTRVFLLMVLELLEICIQNEVPIICSLIYLYIIAYMSCQVLRFSKWIWAGTCMSSFFCFFYYIFHELWLIRLGFHNINPKLHSKLCNTLWDFVVRRRTRLDPSYEYRMFGNCSEWFVLLLSLHKTCSSFRPQFGVKILSGWHVMPNG